MSTETAGAGETPEEVRNFAVWTMQLTFGAIVALTVAAWLFMFVQEFLSGDPTYGPLLTWLPVVIVSALVVYSLKFFKLEE